MKREVCPDEAAVSRALTTVSDGKLARHLRACASCRRTAAELAQAIAFARRLPTNVPVVARTEELRVALLASAGVAPVTAGSRTAQRRSAAVLAAIAFVALLLGHRRHERPPARSHASISPAVGTRYAVVSFQPRETVRLWEGELALEVDPLGPGEHFIVEVGDGESWSAGRSSPSSRAGIASCVSRSLAVASRCGLTARRSSFSTPVKPGPHPRSARKGSRPFRRGRRP
jgi:hypothetical protein